MAEGEPQVCPVDVLDGNSDLGGNPCQGEGRGRGLSPHLGNAPLCSGKGCARLPTAANQPHILPSQPVRLNWGHWDGERAAVPIPKSTLPSAGHAGCASRGHAVTLAPPPLSL